MASLRAPVFLWVHLVPYQLNAAGGSVGERIVGEVNLSGGLHVQDLQARSALGKLLHLDGVPLDPMPQDIPDSFWRRICFKRTGRAVRGRYFVAKVKEGGREGEEIRGGAAHDGAEVAGEVEERRFDFLQC